VNTGGSSDKDRKELVVKNLPLQQPDNQDNKTAKSFLNNLFNKKPEYKQSTLY